jgi:hypothetical protein
MLCRFFLVALTIFFGGLDSANAATPEELKNSIATMINLNGLLCASVTDVKPLELNNHYQVTCIEYGGGSGQVRYIFDALHAKAVRE